MLPISPKEPLQRNLEKVKGIHEEDLKAGFGRVYFPFALKRKYPNADQEWGWQGLEMNNVCGVIQDKKI